MKDFYIFLDIDGVLWDWAFVKEQIALGKQKMGGIIRNFNPESIRALNTLIQKLQANYKVQLVVSSTWRYDLGYAINVLYANGLKYNGEVFATPITSSPNKRALEILEFLSDKENYEFVVIDDGMFDYLEHFDKKNIIKTNMQNDSLNISHINKYLEYIQKEKE